MNSDFNNSLELKNLKIGDFLFCPSKDGKELLLLGKDYRENSKSDWVLCNIFSNGTWDYEKKQPKQLDKPSMGK